jgi:hypothetical protein
LTRYPSARPAGENNAKGTSVSIPAVVQELIDGSGNSFHAKVARWFVANGWTITISPYYLDQSQGKARELDLIAEKTQQFSNSWGKYQGTIAIRLFVECKYLQGPSVFWFTAKDRVAVKRMLVSRGYEATNTYTDQHHYLGAADRVAKLFASSKGRDVESEPFYKALNQSLNGLVSMKNQAPKVFMDRRHGGDQITLDFPVVVCNSFAQVYAADFNGQAETRLVNGNFLLDVQYAYVDQRGGSQNEHFLLDIVELDRLEEFAAAVSNDATLAGFFRARD